MLGNPGAMLGYRIGYGVEGHLGPQYHRGIVDMDLGLETIAVSGDVVVAT